MHNPQALHFSKSTFTGTKPVAESISPLSEMQPLAHALMHLPHPLQ
jgi:hypothetical protein